MFAIWVAFAILSFVTARNHVRPGHQVLLIVAWGIIGAAFGGCWFVIEVALASWMDLAGTRHRKLIAACLYLLFFGVMMVALTTISSGSDPNDFRSMAWITFLVVAGLPSRSFAERFGGPISGTRAMGPDAGDIAGY